MDSSSAHDPTGDAIDPRFTPGDSMARPTGRRHRVPPAEARKPRTAMALRRAHHAKRASRANRAHEAGRERAAWRPEADASAARRTDDGPWGGGADSSGSAPRGAGHHTASLPDELARLACELIPLCKAPAHTESFRAELLVHLRLARPDVSDRALALALIQIRLQLIACPPPPADTAGTGRA